MTDYTLKQTEFGSFEFFPKPTEPELRQHYETRYFQQGKGSYKDNYCNEELLYFKSEAIIADHTLSKYGRPEMTLLDVGCGQGYFAIYFDNRKITCCFSFV